MLLYVLQICAQLLYSSRHAWPSWTNRHVWSPSLFRLVRIECTSRRYHLMWARLPIFQYWAGRANARLDCYGHRSAHARQFGREISRLRSVLHRGQDALGHNRRRRSSTRATVTEHEAGSPQNANQIHCGGPSMTAKQIGRSLATPASGKTIFAFFS